MPVIVRAFVEADRTALRKLFVESRDAAFSWVAPGTHKLEDFDASTAGENILVAEHASGPVGFASVWQADSFLHNLFIHPQHQGRGVGTMLLIGCDKYFSSVPTLKCLKANVRAMRFYQSQGWVVRSEADGPEGPYVLMERTRSNDAIPQAVVSGQA